MPHDATRWTPVVHQWWLVPHGVRLREPVVNHGRRHRGGDLRITTVGGSIVWFLMVALSHRVHETSSEITSWIGHADTLSTALSAAQIERSTAITLGGLAGVRGWSDRGSRVWEPSPDGVSIMVVAGLSCERSSALLEALEADLLAHPLERDRVLIVPLAGDAFALAPWKERFDARGLATVLGGPRVDGERLNIPAVPAVLVWRDGNLTDVLVGTERYAERRPVGLGAGTE